MIIFLLTYFLVAHSCTGNDQLSDSNNSSNSNNIAKAGLFSLESSAVLSDQSVQVNQDSDEIQFNEGWSPILYKLTIEPHFESATSDGVVWIDIARDLNIKELLPIVLDINNITIIDTHLYRNPGENQILLDTKTEYGTNKDTFIVSIIRGVEKDENVTLQLRLKFISQLSDTLQGFYRVRHNSSNKLRWLASTQFSPIDARRAFPCFDRPDKKAQFQISVIREESKLMALSNMPSSRTWIPKVGYIQEDFDVTPKMSTYLVAFMVTDLVNANITKGRNAENGTVGAPEINIWSQRELSSMTRYAYSVTKKVLPFFEKYFDIPFKLPKIDIVAVPDFGFSAMENWGLITFRESALLVPADISQSSAEHTDRVTSVLAHELAHQWFGNLVTMKWWDDLWLKEGFANYMSYVAIDNIEPTWQALSFFTIDELQKAMRSDSDKMSHQISFPVSKPADIRRIFDPISYSKGGCLLRMMNNFITEEVFIRALREYLQTFSYSNAVQDDLWNVMTKFGHIYGTLPAEYDVKKIMDTWTLQAGYPIITVNRNGSDVIISQQRYMLPEINEDDETRWYVPITFETPGVLAKDGVPFYWLDNVKEKKFSNIVDPNQWFYVNVKRAGYYRVNYDYNSWVILNKNYDILPDVTKGQIIDDVLHLARIELLSYDIPLTFLSKLYGRFDYIIPWKAASTGIDYLTNMLIREPAYEHFKALMLHIIKPIYLHMGFDEISNETHVQSNHRRLIVGYACQYGYDRCTIRAQVFFREWMGYKAANFVSPNLKGIIYCTTIREGGLHEWYFAYNRYLATTSASEKEIILSSLGCTTKPWLLSKYLNMTITPESQIRKQDGGRAFEAVAKNSIGYEIAFDFLVSNIQRISDYFGDGFSTLSKMVSSLTTFMNKDYQLQQFEKFAAKARELNITSIQNSIEMAMEDVKINIHWRKRNYDKLAKFLESLTSSQNIGLD